MSKSIDDVKLEFNKKLGETQIAVLGIRSEQRIQEKKRTEAELALAISVADLKNRSNSSQNSSSSSSAKSIVLYPKKTVTEPAKEESKAQKTVSSPPPRQS